MKKRDIGKTILNLVSQLSIKNIVEYVISGLILNWIIS